MTTTDHLQHGPNFFNSKAECLEFSQTRRKKPSESPKEFSDRVSTNKRHSGFYQTVFHAGDPAQFQEYRNESNGNPCPFPINLSNNLFHQLNPSITNYWQGFHNAPPVSCINTFNYIFNKFKKGIFVQIRNNKLSVFLPFSKSKFENEYSHKLLIDPKFGTVHNFLQHVQNLDNQQREKTGAKTFPYNPNTVSEDPAKWYANNCLLRFENPINETESNILNVKNMLLELCEHRTIPDLEFFINRRDFPILTTDATEPYNHLFGDSQQLISHNYSHFLPILSMSKTDSFADVLIPTHEDWARVQCKQDIWLPPCRSYLDDFSTPWNQRKPTAVFRGKSTGCGTNPQNNQRLKIAQIAAKNPSRDDIPLLNAGITSWQLRPRKNIHSPYLQTINPNELDFDLVPFMSPEEQSTFKYIINVDGHVSAFRLSYELSMGSVLLIVDSPWKIWFSHLLVPYVHFVPIKDDLSDLLSQIEWCRLNDEKCQQIASNALDFYHKFLSKNAILDFLQLSLVNLKKTVGQYFYNVFTPLQTIIQIEQKSILNPLLSYSPPLKDNSSLASIPSAKTYGVLEGTRWVINHLIKSNSLDSSISSHKSLFKNKTSTLSVLDIGSAKIVKKSTKDTSKISEQIHETFIGLNQINKLSKICPNFAFTYAGYHEGNDYVVLNDFVDGPTLAQFLQSPDFNIDEFFLILIQLSFALDIAQNSCAFVHWDLAPWNIVLRELPHRKTFSYILSSGEIYEINTKLVPVIIDFGRSHVINKNIHHGFVQMFSSSNTQDILHLVAQSIASIGHIDKSSLSKIFILAEFIQKPSPNSTVKKLKDQMKNITRYQNIISSKNSHRTTPLNLVNFINSKNLLSQRIRELRIQRVSSIINDLNCDSPKQVFYFSFSHSFHEKIASFQMVANSLDSCSLPAPDNIFFLILTAQTFENYLLALENECSKLIQNHHINTPSPFKNILEKTRDFYSQRIQALSDLPGNPLTFPDLSDFSKIINPDYSEETFLDPNQVQLLIKYSPILQDSLSSLVSLRQEVLFTLFANNRFSFTQQQKKYYLKNLMPILKLSGRICLANCAITPTLKLLANNIYTQDIKQIKQLLKEKEQCDTLTNQLQLYYSTIEILN